MTVLALMTVLGQYWWASNLGVCVAEDAASSPTLTSLRELLQAMPLEELFIEWRALEHGVEIPSDVRHAFAAARVRALVLDELECRDHVGFRRWLNGGAVDRPDQHIRDDQDLGPVSQLCVQAEEDEYAVGPSGRLS
jgi:hypothetical protein